MRRAGQEAHLDTIDSPPPVENIGINELGLGRDCRCSPRGFLPHIPLPVMEFLSKPPYQGCMSDHNRQNPAGSCSMIRWGLGA